MNFLTLKTPETRAAIEQVFGKWLLCENLEVATKISFKYNLNCVTLEGHRVSILLTLTKFINDCVPYPRQCQKVLLMEAFTIALVFAHHFLRNWWLLKRKKLPKKRSWMQLG